MLFCAKCPLDKDIESGYYIIPKIEAHYYIFYRGYYEHESCWFFCLDHFEYILRGCRYAYGGAIEDLRLLYFEESERTSI
jgi:hypothetical protein